MNFLSKAHAIRDNAISKGVCAICGNPVNPESFTPAGQREYRISGACEPCFDDLFPPEGDDA